MPTEDPDSQLKKEPYESCLKQKMAESRGSSSRLMLLFLTLIYTQGPDPQIVFREDVHMLTYLPYISSYPLNILTHLQWGRIGSRCRSRCKKKENEVEETENVKSLQRRN